MYEFALNHVVDSETPTTMFRTTIRKARVDA